jgi:sigma-B regulation protein RsbU (phosphoserine phosphatase)
MELARAMQEAMLPSGPARHAGIAIGTCWEFAQEVGGDFHFFLSEGNRLAVVLGDVSGNGVPAALAATSIGLLLPRLHPLDDPRRALGELNADLMDNLPGDAFVTLILAEFDPDAAALKVWNAGHPPPLLWSTRKQSVITTEIYNPLLGVVPRWSGNPEIRSLDAGDVLVIYSDGLIEARNEDREMFGIERAAAVLQANGCKEPQAIADTLMTAVNAWGPVQDDLTIVVCKYTGKPATPSISHADAAGVPPAW